MKQHEAKRFLKEQGFFYVRDVRHGERWEDSYQKYVTLQRDLESNWRAEANFRADVERIVRDRQAVVSKKPTVQDVKPNEPLKAPWFKKPEWFSPDKTQWGAADTTAVFDTEPSLPIEPIPEPKAPDSIDSEVTSPMLSATVQDAPVEMLTRKSKQERAKIGEILYKKITGLEEKDFPLLSKEDVANLFAHANYVSPSAQVAGILSGTISSVNFYRDKATGQIVFDAKDVLGLVRSRLAQTKTAESPEVDEAEEVEVQETLEARPVQAAPAASATPGAFGRPIEIPALPKRVSEFYARVARKHNTTVPLLFQKILSRQAEIELERIDAQMEAEIQKLREKLYSETDFDVDLE